MFLGVYRPTCASALATYPCTSPHPPTCTAPRREAARPTVKASGSQRHSNSFNVIGKNQRNLGGVAVGLVTPRCTLCAHVGQCEPSCPWFVSRMCPPATPIPSSFHHKCFHHAKCTCPGRQAAVSGAYTCTLGRWCAWAPGAGCRCVAAYQPGSIPAAPVAVAARKLFCSYLESYIVIHGSQSREVARRLGIYCCVKPRTLSPVVKLSNVTISSFQLVMLHASCRLSLSDVAVSTVGSKADSSTQCLLLVHLL